VLRQVPLPAECIAQLWASRLAVTSGVKYLLDKLAVLKGLSSRDRTRRWAGGETAATFVFVSNDRVAAITAFYERKLNTGNWQVTSSAAGQVGFRLRNGKTTIASGTVAIAVRGERTEIKVDAYP